MPEYRVRRTRLSINILWLDRFHELRAAATKRGQPLLGPTDPHAECKEIAKDEFHVQAYRQWADLSKYVARL